MEYIEPSSRRTEGSVTIQATVTGETGEISKEITFTVGPQTAIVNEDACGTWTGTDDDSNSFTFEVSSDGKAVFTVYAGNTYNFTFERLDTSGAYDEYYFTYDDDPSVKVSISYKYDDESSLYVYDDKYIFNDYKNVVFYQGSATISKE